MFERGAYGSSSGVMRKPARRASTCVDCAFAAGRLRSALRRRSSFEPARGRRGEGGRALRRLARGAHEGSSAETGRRAQEIGLFWREGGGAGGVARMAAGGRCGSGWSMLEAVIDAVEGRFVGRLQRTEPRRRRGRTRPAECEGRSSRSRGRKGASCERGLKRLGVPMPCMGFAVGPCRRRRGPVCRQAAERLLRAVRRSLTPSVAPWGRASLRSSFPVPLPVLDARLPSF